MLRTKFVFNGAKCKKMFYLGEIDNLKPKKAGKGKAETALESEIPKELDEAETALEPRVPKEKGKKAKKKKAGSALESSIPEELSGAEIAQEQQVPKEKRAGKRKSSKTAVRARKAAEGCS